MIRRCRIPVGRPFYGNTCFGSSDIPRYTSPSFRASALFPRFFPFSHASVFLARARSSAVRSEEHTSELQSQSNLVCRLLLEKKKKDAPTRGHEHPTRPPRPRQDGRSPRPDRGRRLGALPPLPGSVAAARAALRVALGGPARA